jgi:two-component system phosphate regulon sensor histidine kinase PhoR
MRRRLFFFTLLVTVSAFVAMSVLFMAFIGNNLRDRAHEQLASECATLDAAMRSCPEEDRITLLREAAEAGGYRVTLITADGSVRFDSETTKKLESHATRPEVADALMSGTGAAVRYSDTLRCEVMYVAVRTEDGNVIRLSMRLSTVWENIAQLMGGMVWVALGLLALCAAFAWLLSARAVRPIRELTGISETIAGGRYDMRIRSCTASRDEFGKLSRAFNIMAGRLESTIGDLNRENEKFNAVLEAMSEGIIAVDTRLCVTLANASVIRMLGIGTDPVNMHIFEATRLERLETLIKRALETGETVSEEMYLGKTREQRRLIELHVFPMRRGGKVTGAVLRAADVQALRALERMRSDFAANVSHELKTPLTSIRGFVETLRNGAVNDPGQAMRFLKIIDMETARLSRLISDVLLLSSIESGERPAFVPVNLQAAVEETLEFVRPAAAEKGITLSFINEAGPAVVMGNTDWAKQMLIDFADNAIKYTGTGGRVAIEIGTEKGQVLIKVRDNGIGIGEKHLQRIFERFYRVDKSRFRALGSTGLGLAIVKHIVMQMNGEIEVKSEPGKGTEFTVRLPRVANENGE